MIYLINSSLMVRNLELLKIKDPIKLKISLIGIIISRMIMWLNTKIFRNSIKCVSRIKLKVNRKLNNITNKLII